MNTLNRLPSSSSRPIGQVVGFQNGECQQDLQLARMKTSMNSSIQKCCYASACNLEASYCNECGKALMRCAAFEECGGLVDRDGCCGVCFSAELHLEASGLKKAAMGGTLALPLVVSNRSSVDRPIFLKGIWVREDEGAWSKHNAAWDRLEAGSSKPISLLATELDRPGTHRFEVAIALASRFRWREETFAFCTTLDIQVEKDKDLVVQQNINYAAGAPQTGATIYAPVRVTAKEKPDAETKESLKQLRLTRASVYERSLGLRGMSDGIATKRDAKFRWNGFQAGMAPFDSPIVTANSLLSFGRSRSKLQEGTNDVRILILNADGSLNEDASRGVSRNHFCLWIENDRLMFRVESENGASVDGNNLQRGDTTELKSGSRFSPLIRHSSRAEFEVRFEVEHQNVVEILINQLTGN